MEGLARFDEGGWGGRVFVSPQGQGVVANVAGVLSVDGLFGRGRP
jgi:hypothetical protein